LASLLKYSKHTKSLQLRARAIFFNISSLWFFTNLQAVRFRNLISNEI